MERVSSGILLSEAIRESGGFEKKLAAVIVTGEEAGHLDKMLERIAGSYEHESDLALNKLVNLLEPADRDLYRNPDPWNHGADVEHVWKYSIRREWR